VALGAANATGTVFAAQQLLRRLGLRFLSWDETLLPPAPASVVALAPVDMTFIPTFEYREVYGSQPAYGYSDSFHGNQAGYANPPGGVHTSYNMFPTPGTNCTSNGCPPADLFKTHNEWVRLFFLANAPSQQQY
jgi:hypothetical protein